MNHATYISTNHRHLTTNFGGRVPGIQLVMRPHAILKRASQLTKSNVAEVIQVSAGDLTQPIKLGKIWTRGCTDAYTERRFRTQNNTYVKKEKKGTNSCNGWQ